MKSSKAIMAVMALFALSTFTVITPSAYWSKSSVKNIKKNNSQETLGDFIDRLVAANLSLIQNILFDEYSDAIVLNVNKDKNNKAFVNYLMANIKTEFKNADSAFFTALLSNKIEEAVRLNTEKQFVCDIMKLFRLIDKA